MEVKEIGNKVKNIFKSDDNNDKKESKDTESVAQEIGKKEESIAIEKEASIKNEQLESKTPIKQLTSVDSVFKNISSK